LIDVTEVEFDKAVEHRLKVYNPYEIDIPLDKLKFGMAYINAYKEVLEKRRLPVNLIDKNVKFLKSKDTTQFTFKLGKTKIEKPGYFRIAISENDLHFGLNGEIIKIK